LLELCLNTSNEIGDWKSWRQAIGLLGGVHQYRGEYEDASKKYVDAYKSTERGRNFSQMAFQLAIRSRSLFYYGRYEAAVSAAEQSIELDDAPMVTLNAMAVHVLEALRLAQWDRLTTQLDTLDKHIADNAIKLYVQLDGYAAAAEARLAL